MGQSEPDLLLAFDFGMRRIGVASANRHTATGSPLKALLRGRETPWAAIDALIREWRPDQLLVGLPGSVTASETAAAAQAFAGELAERYGLPVVTVDETLTSRAAHSELIMARRSGLMGKRIRKEQLDSLAACLIAEQWLREQ
jgi:putative Holliday junction resolvase